MITCVKKKCNKNQELIKVFKGIKEIKILISFRGEK